MPIKTPYSTTELRQLHRDNAIAQAIADLTRMHKEFFTNIEKVKGMVAETRTHAERIKKLPKGERGESGIGPRGLKGEAGKDGKDGKDGYTPVKGKDYFSEDEIEHILVQTLMRIRTPRDGEDAVVDKEEIANFVLDLIKEKGLLGTEHIKGLRGEIDSYRHQMAMKQAGQHGGGTTVSAGTNITLTPLQNGTTRIDASGGAGATFSDPLTGGPGDTVFTFAVEPTYVIADSLIYFNGAGCTIVGTTVTLDIPLNSWIKGVS